MATETTTVLFTDLVGSTALMSEVGPDRSDALRREHFDLLRQVVAETGGREIKNVGDGLMVVFGSNVRALDAAAGIQQRVEVANRAAREPLMVRIGISHGDADVDDGDYFGPPVVEAARLCAVAGAGTILVSDIVKVLAGGRAGRRFEPRGPIELKGLPEPLEVHELVWEPLEGVGALAVPLPSRLAQPATVFVGRDEPRAQLEQHLKEVGASGRPHVVLISGDAGIGKTSLVSEVARDAHRRGDVVLYGRCDEDLSVPYQPWVEVLRQLVTAAPEALLAGVRPELDRLVPELAHRRPSVAADDADPHVLFTGVVELLGAAGRLATLLVVLDDLHWADRQTLQLLRYVAMTDAAVRTLFVGTFRASDLAPGDPMTDVLGALRREAAVSRLALSGLSDVELLEMMKRSAGHDLDEAGLELRDALLSETDGNPFFVGEILRHLAETGAIFQSDGRWVAGAELRGSGLPVSVREVIGRRIAHLGGDTDAVLAAASVLGRDFDLATLAQLADTDPDALLGVLEGAVAANLLVETGPGAFSFAHALIEHTLYDGLGMTRRARLHARVATLIEAATAGDPGDRIGEVAHHWMMASGPSDPGRAIDAAWRAGDHALARFAPDEARRWYEQALELVGPGDPDDRRRAALLTGLGKAQRQLGDAAHRRTLLDACALAGRIGDRDMLARAALANNRGLFSVSGGVDEERVAALEAASAAVGADKPALRARLLSLLSLECMYRDPLAQRLALADEAVRLARGTDDRSALAVALTNRSLAAWAPKLSADRAADATEAYALAAEVDDLELSFWAATQHHATGMRTGDLVAAETGYAALTDIAERLGQPSLQWAQAFLQSGRALWRGQVEEAEAAAERARVVGVGAGEPDAEMLFVAQLMGVRQAQGRQDEMLPILEVAATQYVTIPSFRSSLALIHAERGSPDDVVRLLADDVRDGFAAYQDDISWLAGLLTAAGALGLARVLPDGARQLHEMLEPFADQFDYLGVSSGGAVATALGLLCDALDRPDAADRHFGRALELLEAMRGTFHRARTMVFWARALARRHDPDVRARAAVLAAQAGEVAAERGLGHVARQATSVLTDQVGP